MLPSSHRAFVTYLVFYELAVYLSVDAFLPALPDVMQAFPHHSWPIAYTITGWYLGTALTPLLMGPLAEHIGYRRTLFAGAAVFLGATLVCALTSNFTWFLIARILQGSCVAAVLTPGYGSIHHLMEQKQAIKTVAWMSAITVLGPSAGPMLGAVVIQWLDWRWIFAGLFALALVCNVGLYFRMPTLNHAPHDYDAPKARLIHQYARILGAPHYMRYKGSQCLLFACLIAWITTSPMLLMESLKFDAVSFAWAQVAVFGAFIMGTKAVKYGLQQWQPTALLVRTILIAMLCGLLVLGCGQLYPTHTWWFIAAIAGMAFGIGMSLSSLDRLAIECSDQPMAMRVSMGGFLFSIFGFGGSLSANLIGHERLLPLGILMCSLAWLAGLIMVCKRSAPHHVAG